MGDKPPAAGDSALGPTLEASDGSAGPVAAPPRVAGERYRIEALLGAGGMGSVYRAIDEVLGKEVALKFLDDKLADGPALLERLRDEVLLAQEVSHPNVCRTYDLEELGDSWVVKMEFVDGETLARRVARAGRLAVAEALAIGRQIAEGLAAAHDRGVIHRDLKPQNVLIEADTGRVVLMDFGLARMAELTARGPHGIVGTPEYMAPEQVRGGPVDRRADLYALGCVVYHMLAGEVVFPAADAMAAARRHVEDPPPDLRARRPDVPAWLSAVVARLLDKDPERRFADARDVLTSLAPPRRRWPLLAVAIVGVAGLVAAGAVLRAQRPEREWRPVVRELTAYEENSDAPVWSPDGRSIAYFSDREESGRFRIYVESIADGTSRPITPRGRFAIFPTWARDGRAIFYRAEIEGRSGIHRVRLADEESEPVVADTFRPGAVDCGAGRLLFVRVGRDRLRLVVRDTTTGDERDVIRLAPGEEIETVDCDRAGSRVVYDLFGISHDRRRYALWTVGLDGSGARALVADEHLNLAPTLHPDGRSVVFISSRGGKINLWELALAGGQPAQLTFGEGPDYAPDISPDGRQILFQLDTTNQQIFAYGPGGERRRLTSTAGGAQKLSVSPDGRDVVAGARRARREQVILVPAAGGEERTLAEGRLPGFSPDGQEVVFASPGSPSRILAIAREGGAARLLGELPGRAADLSVGPDGIVHVGLFTATGLEAWRIALAGGAPEREAPAPWAYVLPAPAGGWRAALEYEYAASTVLHPFGVHLFPPQADLADRPAHTIRAYGMAWDRDGTSLVYHDRFAVHRLDLATRRDVVIARPANQTTPVMAVSPDGETIFMVEYMTHVRRQLLTNYGERSRP